MNAEIRCRYQFRLIEISHTKRTSFEGVWGHGLLWVYWLGSEDGGLITLGIGVGHGGYSIGFWRVCFG
eukprot:1359651-Amorphochlora_amoeboformis.AAC.1